MRKSFILALAFFLLSGSAIFPVKLSAASSGYALLQGRCRAKVIEILDGDALRVQTLDTKETALVRFLGVNAKGNKQSVSYLTNLLSGREVSLLFDYGSQYVDGRWNIMLVYLENTLVNAQLLKKGLAVIDEHYLNATFLSDFLAGEHNAVTLEIGLWKPSGHKPQPELPTSVYPGTYTGDGININTCTPEQIVAYCIGVPLWLAHNIADYRLTNPYRRVTDIKFVPGMTKTIFDLNRYQFTVCTNINRATDRELMTVFGFDWQVADRIREHRSKTSFTSVEDLLTFELCATSEYYRVEPFVSIYDSMEVKYTIPAAIADINNSDAEELIAAGLTEDDAENLLAVRYYNGYTIKYLGELQYFPDIYMSLPNQNELADNLYTTTDRGSYVNANTATYEQLVRAGFTPAQAQVLLRYSGKNLNGQNLPLDVTGLDGRISLYTNVNKAGRVELMSLSQLITPLHADRIIAYRNDQPFGSYEEFRYYLEEELDLGEAYVRIKDFIVFR